MKIECKLKSFCQTSPFKLSALLSKDSESLNVTFSFSKGLENLLYSDSKSVDNLREHNLWKETCFELFLKNKNSTEYIEVNISTTGSWNIYVFEDERIGMKEYSLSQGPFISNNLRTTSEIGFKLGLNSLPDFIKESNFQYQISAVLKTIDDCFFYAIKHLDNHPNFHSFKAFNNLDNYNEAHQHSEQ